MDTNMTKEKKRPKKAIYVLTAILVMETAALLYFNSIFIPTKLLDEYNLADKQIDLVNTELDRIGQQKKEHQYPVEALSALLTFKPQSCGFQTINIGDYPSGAWIRLLVRSTDPAAINSYVDNLSANDFFKNISIENLKMDAAGITTATVVIRKGDVKQ
jgi:Tfp pilus assembly protein PilN